MILYSLIWSLISRTLFVTLSLTALFRGKCNNSMSVVLSIINIPSNRVHSQIIYVPCLLQRQVPLKEKVLPLKVTARKECGKNANISIPGTAGKTIMIDCFDGWNRRFYLSPTGVWISKTQSLELQTWWSSSLYMRRPDTQWYAFFHQIRICQLCDE